MAKKSHLTAAKARLILRDGTVHGKPLTERQKRFFHAVESGQTPLRIRKKGRKKR